MPELVGRGLPRKKYLYHFDSVSFITATVIPTHFSHRNSEKHHYEKNFIPKLATFENSWENLSFMQMFGSFDA